MSSSAGFVATAACGAKPATSRALLRIMTEFIVCNLPQNQSLTANRSRTVARLVLCMSVVLLTPGLMSLAVAPDASCTLAFRRFPGVLARSTCANALFYAPKSISATSAVSDCRHDRRPPRTDDSFDRWTGNISNRESTHHGCDQYYYSASSGVC